MEFAFKQFKVFQNDRVFKIGTDSIILGSWLNFGDASKILDIGCGTGVLSLMVAQKSNNATIIGVDLQKEATDLSLFNFSNSNFSKRLDVINASLTQFAETTNLKFDFFISNPPFFTSGAKSKQANMGIARHNDALPIPVFWKCVNRLALESAKVGIIYPFEEAQDCVLQALEMGWYLNKRLNIYPKEEIKIGEIPKRVALQFSKENLPFELEELTILDNNGNYMDEYKNMTNAFYF